LKGYNALHLACFGGHVTVVGLLLSRAADLLHSSDLNGKTCLHIAATYGHYAMVEVLLGQGAEINATDKVVKNVYVLCDFYCLKLNLCE